MYFFENSPRYQSGDYDDCVLFWQSPSHSLPAIACAFSMGREWRRPAIFTFYARSQPYCGVTWCHLLTSFSYGWQTETECDDSNLKRRNTLCHTVGRVHCRYPMYILSLWCFTSYFLVDFTSSSFRIKCWVIAKKKFEPLQHRIVFSV